MPPVNRRSPSPVRRRSAVAGSRTPGADREARLRVDPEREPAPVEVGAARRGKGVSLLKRLSPAESRTDAQAMEHHVQRLERADRPRSPLLLALLGLASLLVIAAVVVSAVSWVHASQPAKSTASSNVALVDAPATQEAAAAAVDILQKAYSYTYTTIDANLNAAVAVMTPEMGAKHRANFDTIRKAVTEAKTTTKASVVSDGVRLLSGDRAEVLAFVVVTGDNGGTALQPSGYRFTASLLRVDGKWLLSDLTES